MSDLESDLKQLMARKAAELPIDPLLPPRVVLRIRRRRSASLAGAVAVISALGVIIPMRPALFHPQEQRPAARDSVTVLGSDTLPAEAMPPGRFRIDSGAKMSLTIADPGWSFIEADPTGHSITHGLGGVVEAGQSRPEISVHRITGVFDPDSLRRPKPRLLPLPRSLPDWLASHPYVTTIPVGPVAVGDSTGIAVDATIAPVPHDLSCPDACVQLFALDEKGSVPFALNGRVKGPYQVFYATAARFIFVELGRATVVVSVIAPKPYFDVFLPLAEEVVATMRFH